MCKYEYIGCFFDKEELFKKVANVRKNPLLNEKASPHVTFVYRPTQFPKELFGHNITATVIGYGNDGHNEGLLVTLHANHPTINKMIDEIPVPHITLAVSENGQAVNTKFISFSSIPPFQIVGHFDGHLEEQIQSEGL